MSQGRRWVDPALKTEYLEWLMTPPGEREPETKLDMAEKLGVSPRTLYNWEMEPEFQERLRSLKIEWGNRWYPDILNRLMDIVLYGPPAQSVAAGKVLLAHIDVKEIKDDQEVKFNEELAIRMKAIAKELGYEVVE